jgi:hypothetical protein
MPTMPPTNAVTATSSANCRQLALRPSHCSRDLLAGYAQTGHTTPVDPNDWLHAALRVRHLHLPFRVAVRRLEPEASAASLFASWNPPCSRAIR